MVELRFVDPGHLADAIAGLMGDAARLGVFSRNAIDAAAGHLSYERHMRDVDAALARY